MFSSSLRYQLKESVGLGWKSFFKISGPTLSGERTTLSQVVLITEMLKVNTVPSGMLMLMTPTLTILKLRSYNAESVVISHSRTSTNHMFNMWYVDRSQSVFYFVPQENMILTVKQARLVICRIVESTFVDMLRVACTIDRLRWDELADKKRSSPKPVWHRVRRFCTLL